MANRLMDALGQITHECLSESSKSLHDGQIFALVNPLRFGRYLWDIFYIMMQCIIIFIFKPPPPNAPKQLMAPHGRIAVIGAGVTGVSSAAHAIAHGFEVVIFEAAPEDKLGGIWAQVNTTSGLQLNSLLYRFHPGVLWSKAFPLQKEIVGEIRRVWKEYHLDTRTRFNTKVTSVKRASPPNDASEWECDRDRSRWVINEGEDGIFDAVIVTIGTCGEPNMIKFSGMPDKETKEKSDSPSQDPSSNPLSSDEDDKTQTKKKDSNDQFTKTIIHSSELDSPSFKLEAGQRVVVIGSGASGVEAVETVLEKFGSVLDKRNDKEGVNVSMIARDDKWIIPRNIIIDTSIAGQPFGREMPLSFLWETFLRYWQYWGIEELIPKDVGIYEGTPVVNDAFLEHVRSGRCHYIRGSPLRFTGEGIIVGARKSKGTKNKTFQVQQKEPKKKSRGAVMEVEQGAEKLIKADVIVLATGYKKPTVDFLPDDLFPEGYERPDLYLQNFSTEDWSILMTNSAYMSAIGTVGHFHIGIYTRILMTLLLDESARPSPKDMKLWVDVLRFIKRGATGGALGFFTYMELTIWLLGFHLLRPDRLRWLFFIMNGWGVYAKN